MAFEACINPHNGLFGSTTLLGMIRVDYASIKIPPQPVIADDASVAILMKSRTVQLYSGQGKVSVSSRSPESTCQRSIGAKPGA